jgi:4-amino-4-deoxy-L-arabinose transferase-like glycosyltransferase
VKLANIGRDATGVARSTATARALLPELTVSIGSFVFFAWGLNRNGYGSTYYAASARSMSTSFRAFFFDAYDPGGWITTDKPPFSLWVQATSIRVFGLSSWSLLLPSAVCGALAVGLLMATVRRAWGREAGLVAGIALALTPTVVAVSRSNNPDAVLVLLCVAAAWAVSRAVESGRLWWMLLAGALCGLGFLTKLSAVGLVMPALGCAFLVGAQQPFRRRALHAVAGVLAFAAVAGLWVGIVQATPVTHRPWVGSTGDGSPVTLIIDSSGAERVAGQGGGVLSGPISGDLGGEPSIDRLFNDSVGDQVMWLSPLAIAAAAAGVAGAIRSRRRDLRLASICLWTTWTVTVFVAFSFVLATVRVYYVSLLAPSLAALVGIGVVAAREARWRGRTVAIGAILATVVLQLVLLDRVDAWQWLRWLILVGVGVAAGCALVALVWRRVGDRFVVVPLAAAGVVLVCAPAAWSLSGIERGQTGGLPEARPGTSTRTAASPTAAPAAPTGTTPTTGLGSGALTPGMVRWLRGHRTTELWIVAVPSARDADELILRGDSVLALGGFIGLDPADRPARVAGAVAARDLRFFSFGGIFGVNARLAPVIEDSCAVVDPSMWEGNPGDPTLYDCKGRARQIRAHAEAYGTHPQGKPPGPEIYVQLFEAAKCFQREGIDIASNHDFTDPAVRRAAAKCKKFIPASIREGRVQLPGGIPNSGSVNG